MRLMNSIVECPFSCARAISTGQNSCGRLLQAGFLASDLGMKRLPARVMAQPSLTAQLVQDILQTCQAFLDLAHGLFFSERCASMNACGL